MTLDAQALNQLDHHRMRLQVFHYQARNQKNALNYRQSGFVREDATQSLTSP